MTGPRKTTKTPPPGMSDTDRQRQHDATMREIEEFRQEIADTVRRTEMRDWLNRGKPENEIADRLDYALWRCFPDGVYPKTGEVLLALQRFCADHGWPKFHRNTVANYIGRGSRR